MAQVSRRVRNYVAAVRVLPAVLALVNGCGASAPDGSMKIGNPVGAYDCSQIHRSVSRWAGAEVPECGPDLAGQIELTPVGNHQLLARRRFSTPYAVWPVSAGGQIGPAPTPVSAVEGGSTAAFTLLPGSPPRVLVADPRLATWSLYLFGSDGLQSPQVGAWPQGPLFVGGNGQPWGRQFIGLSEGVLLDRNLGDGSSRLWRFVTAPGADGTLGVELVSDPVGSPREAFRRGHRLVPLGAGRLLEWLPRACSSGSDASAGSGGGAGGACTGADFNVWGYAIPPASGVQGELFGLEPVSAGSWSDIGAGNEILADDTHLFVWTRAAGRLRSYALDPGAADPLAGPVLDDFTAKELVSEDWRPPTRAPAIKHLVLILQDGRSFDSYFGQYCTGAASPGGGPAPCEEGAACCERMPAAIPGASTCAPLDPASGAHAPVATPDCLRSKINGGAMDGFALAATPTTTPPTTMAAPTTPASTSMTTTTTTRAAACGDPLDFSCAGVGSAAGALTAYQRRAASGAVADRFFQSYAFVEDAGSVIAADPVVQNLLYLVAARFSNPLVLRDTPLLTKELARLEVPWAVYAGSGTLARMRLFGVPIFYDPDWYPFRALEGGELEHDLATGQLPSVSVVVPDGADIARSEAPGHPSERAIGFVDGLMNTIASSPTYGNDTLVLLTYTTAGGFYDHVPPPPPPPLIVDGSTGDVSKASPVHYGPRVPLMVLPPFARPDHVSHVPLEMSSITVFVEWNWMYGSTLYRTNATDDTRRYRDSVANNLGSLIDPARAGIAVPEKRE